MLSLSQVIADFQPAGSFEVPPNWMQGRTAYGGLSAALALQAVIHSNPELPSLKSMHINFIAPASGALTFASRMLRSGKSVTSVESDCLVGESVVLRSMMLFSQARESSIIHEHGSRPPVGGPLQYPVLAPHPKLSPACAFNFEMRPAGGSELISGAENPELLVWVKHLDARDVHPAVALVALADALPPAAITAFIKPAPVSSVSWTVDFVRPAQPGEWFLMRSFSRQAAHGYSLQDMEIWDEAGNLVIWGRQTVAVFA